MATPNKAMKPTADDTLSDIPRMLRASIPPNKASGTIDISTSACLKSPNAPYNNRNIIAANGTIKANLE